MSDIWTQHYPNGVPADIYDKAQRYESRPALFEESGRPFADNVAFSSMGVHITYAELDARTRQFFAWPQRADVQQGDHVALTMLNQLTCAVCMFGAMRAGAMAFNTNAFYTPSSLAHQPADAGAQTIINAENDRKKAMIIVSGFNVYTNEIEAAAMPPWPARGRCRKHAGHAITRSRHAVCGAQSPRPDQARRRQTRPRPAYRRQDSKTRRVSRQVATQECGQNTAT